MKRTVTIACACVLMCSIQAFAKLDTLTVIHVNDSHSNLTAYGAAEYGGIARAASIIGLWKMTEPNPILIHGGDLMVGTLMFNAYFGVPELQILNMLGFDALGLGNHEFDVGPKQLAGLFAMAQLNPDFDILCTNATKLDSVPELKAFVKPYAVKQRGNIKIGLVALTTPAANVESNPAPVVLEEKTMVQMAMQRVAELKAGGCQVVILISHLGVANDQAVAQYLSGVDAIIGAHSHTVLTQVVKVNGIPIVQAGEFYRYVGKLRLVYDGVKTSVLDYTLQEITSAIPAEPTIDATLTVLKAGIVQQYNPLLGDPYQPLTAVKRLLYYKPVAFDTLDTPMGNMITTAMLDKVPEADCALEATGHIVENLYPGKVSTADLFRVYPYGYNTSDGLGFRLASFKLYGAQIAGVLEALLGFVQPETNSYDYLIQSAGLDFNVDTTVVKPDQKIWGIKIKGKAMTPESLYTIVSSDQVVGYLQNLFQIQPIGLQKYAVSVFQVAKEYAAKLDTLRFWRTGHNRVVKPTGVKGRGDTGSPRQFSLEQNYPNPFNPETTIAFSLPETSPVSLAVYDINGREVAVLAHERIGPGRYQKTFHAGNLASGIYFCKLIIGSAVLTRKMVLMK
jgi:5'-nucleotidase/UDP-sugar diphosphatase